MSDVKVYVRFRPTQGTEKNYTLQGNQDVTVDGHSFHFDNIYNESTTQKQVYEDSGSPLVQDLMKGFNVAFMAYGQTGAGKTHTMLGGQTKSEYGIIPRIMSDLFACETRELQIQIQCSYVEIYMEKIRDLLNPASDNLKLREAQDLKQPQQVTMKRKQPLAYSVNKKSVYVHGATVQELKHMDDMLELLDTGSKNRVVAKTLMNEASSRSHAICIVMITITDTVKKVVKHGKLFLVDLAGSEDIRRSGATGVTLDQAKMINKSLSTLSHVIQLLTESSAPPHIPYRNSKLTRLLSDALGGNSKTVLMLNVTPALDSTFETVKTLQFGTRAKMMKNHAMVNQDISLESYKIMVDNLKAEVSYWMVKFKELEKQKKTPRLVSYDSVPLPIVTVPNLEAKTVMHVRQDTPLELSVFVSSDEDWVDHAIVKCGDLIIFDVENLFRFDRF